MNTSPSLRSTPIGPLAKALAPVGTGSNSCTPRRCSGCASRPFQAGSQARRTPSPSNGRVSKPCQSQAQQRRGSRVGAPCVGQLATGALGVRPTHRLACSPSREAEFSVPISDLLGVSLWPFATEELASQEQRLAGIGWHDNQASPALEFTTGTNDFGTGAHPTQPMPLDAVHPVGWLDRQAGRNPRAYLMRGRRTRARRFTSALIRGLTMPNHNLHGKLTSCARQKSSRT
jgi:hypothetical protein